MTESIATLAQEFLRRDDQSNLDAAIQAAGAILNPSGGADLLSVAHMADTLGLVVIANRRLLFFARDGRMIVDENDVQSAEAIAPAARFGGSARLTVRTATHQLRIDGLTDWAWAAELAAQLNRHEQHASDDPNRIHGDRHTAAAEFDDPAATLRCSNCGDEYTEIFLGFECRECGGTLIDRSGKHRERPPAPPAPTPRTTRRVKPTPSTAEIVSRTDLDDADRDQSDAYTQSEVLQPNRTTFGFRGSQATAVRVVVAVVGGLATVAGLFAPWFVRGSTPADQSLGDSLGFRQVGDLIHLARLFGQHAGPSASTLFSSQQTNIFIVVCLAALAAITGRRERRFVSVACGLAFALIFFGTREAADGLHGYTYGPGPYFASTGMLVIFASTFL
jgi:predicted RNA-binding Zn-ribbon protein involved in translation (DUF1610 family)